MGEGDAEESIDGHRQRHHPYPLRMVAIAHQRADGLDEDDNQCSKEGRDRTHTDQCGGIDHLRVCVCLIGEAEIGGLHTKGKNYQNQRHVGIHIRNDAITARGCRELGCIEWHKQIVQESANDTRETINGRIFCDSLKFTHIFLLPKEHICDGDSSDDARQVCQESAGYSMTGFHDANAAKVDSKDIEGGICRALEDTA